MYTSTCTNLRAHPLFSSSFFSWDYVPRAFVQEMGLKITGKKDVLLARIRGEVRSSCDSFLRGVWSPGGKVPPIEQTTGKP